MKHLVHTIVLQKKPGFCFVLAVALMVCLLPGDYVVGQPYEEYAVKAAFIHNFAEFVEWPVPPSSDTKSTFDVCIIGTNPFGPAMDVLTKQPVRGRKVQIKRFNPASSGSHCQIVYISSSEKDRLHQILAALKGYNVLTVADAPGFGQSGVMFNFYVEVDKVRFEVNIDEVNRSELKISSKLLKLGRIVHDGS